MTTCNRSHMLRWATVVGVSLWLAMTFSILSSRFAVLDDDRGDGEGELQDVSTTSNFYQNVREATQRQPMQFPESEAKTLASLRQVLYSIPRPDDMKYAINETKSQTLSVTRDVPDNRPAECKVKSYNLTESKLTISVVIPMYNEAPSILIRTLHSILDRTPPQLLADIIIVDDVSTNENMKQALTDYVSALGPKVKLLRLKKKAHLIKARMAGMAASTGDILLFQDGHTEMNQGWAEPVVDYLTRYPNSVIQPTVDSIDQWSIDYEDLSGVRDIWRGVFLWDMRYAWQRVSSAYRQWRSSAAEPFPCPVLVGCSIAVRREYFMQLGGFDQGLDVWGGEQIELSFKTWLCGGRVIIHPCSRIGHIFKPWMKSDVNWRKREEAIAKNNVRVAETWMEGYATYYHASNRIYNFKQVTLTQSDIDGIAEQRELKRKLKCKEFRWYLENILPELKEPPRDARFHGELDNMASSMCLHAADDDYVTLSSDCYLYSRLQEEGEFTFRMDGLLMNSNKCVGVDEYGLLHMAQCGHWPREQGKITFQLLEGHGMTQGKILYKSPIAGVKDACLEQITNVLPGPHSNEQMPQFRSCEEDNNFQLWNVNYHFDYSLVPAPYFSADKRLIADTI